MLFIQQHIINVLIASDPFLILCIPIGTICIISPILYFVNRLRLYSAIVIDLSYYYYVICMICECAKLLQQQLRYYRGAFRAFVSGVMCIFKGRRNSSLHSEYSKKAKEQNVLWHILVLPAEQTVLELVEQECYSDDYETDNEKSGYSTCVVSEVGVILNVVAHTVLGIYHFS